MPRSMYLGGGAYRALTAAGGVVTPPPPSDELAARRALVPETYEPDADTTGLLPSQVLDPNNPAHVYNSPTVNTFTLSPGQVIEDKIIYGDIFPPASGGFRISRCICLGGNHVPSTTSGVFALNGGSARTGIGVIEDCLIKPRRPALNRDGIIGRQFTAQRNEITDVIDGIGIYSLNSSTARADAKAIANYVHTLIYNFPDYNNGVSGNWYPPDSGHWDGNHGDCIQYQGGLGVEILGNSLHGTARPGPVYRAVEPVRPDGTSNDTKATTWVVPGGWTNGAVVIIQCAGSRKCDLSVVVRGNYTRGGLSHYNLKATAPVFTFRNNKVYRNTANKTSGWSGYWVRIDAGTPTGGYDGLLTQVWIDGPYAGQNLTLASRDRGILVG